jgi:SulP family sulfate permease
LWALKSSTRNDVWDVARSKRVIMVVTFIATLSLPIQQAIIIGVFLSLLDYIYSSSQQVSLYALKLMEDGDFQEEPAPEKLEDSSVTVLHVRGSTYFAAARTIQEILPSAKEAQQAVVIARLRETDEVGTTIISVMERYAAELRANGGRLMLSDVHENVKAQLLRTETTEVIPEDSMFMATDMLGASTREALAAAQMWLANKEVSTDEADERKV